MLQRHPLAEGLPVSTHDRREELDERTPVVAHDGAGGGCEPARAAAGITALPRHEAAPGKANVLQLVRSDRSSGRKPDARSNNESSEGSA
jgi:hypothetical protein